MTTDVEDIILKRLDTIEAKVDNVAITVAEIQGERKTARWVSTAIAGIVGAIAGGLASRWK